jgi:superfamily II DNA/RNA helicase
VPFCRGYDVIQQAQSGTGKTATFCAGILHQARARAAPHARKPRVSVRRRAERCSRALQLDYSLMETQALVLGPTRELAQQIEKARALRSGAPQPRIRFSRPDLRANSERLRSSAARCASHQPPVAVPPPRLLPHALV